MLLETIGLYLELYLWKTEGQAVHSFVKSYLGHTLN